MIDQYWKQACIKISEDKFNEYVAMIPSQLLVAFCYLISLLNQRILNYKIMGENYSCVCEKCVMK